MNPVMTVATFPQRPEGISPIGNRRILTDKTQSYVTASSGYTLSQQRILFSSNDDVELEISYRAYDNMERDGTIKKIKTIFLTGVLADDLQMAPGASEEHVGQEEYNTYVAIQEFCERVVDGLDKPLRDSLEQQIGNAFKYGHGVAEVEWEYRTDAPSSEAPKEVPQKGKLSSALDRVKLWMGVQNSNITAATGDITKPVLKNERVRLMPSSIKVKPRNATRFVVDDFMNVLGLVPTSRVRPTGLLPGEIIDREKFLVLTFNKQDEDPRGKSAYRPAVNWYNLKTQIPAEMLRFILEESVPKAVGTLPKDMPPFEFERDENGAIVYEDPDTKKIPKMLTGAESFKRQIEGFRSGSGAVIPYEAKLEPYKKGFSGAADAELFSSILKTVNREMEESMLGQSLAQSEGEHQARSASEQVAEILYNIIFWTRWQVSMMIWFDLLAPAVRMNFGDWALRYMPMVSLGDFIRRDWVTELEALSDGYFKGFIDDSQRPELMAWLNMPKPGESRQELNAKLGVTQQANQDVNGNPITPNNNRPDKQGGTKDRNAGNGTEKKNAKNTRRGTNNVLGHHTGWFSRYSSHIRTSNR